MHMLILLYHPLSLSYREELKKHKSNNYGH